MAPTNRPMPDFSGPGQHALEVILALAGGAPELAAQLRLEDYGRLADRFHLAPPRTRGELEAIFVAWLDNDVGHRIAADPSAVLGVLDLLPANASASASADDALRHILTRRPAKGRAAPRNWIVKLSRGRLRKWLVRSVEWESRKRDRRRSAIDEGLLLAAAAAGEIEPEPIEEDVLLAAATQLEALGLTPMQAAVYTRAAAGFGDAAIAAAVGCAPATVRVHLWRARRRAIAAGWPPLADRRTEGRRRR